MKRMSTTHSTFSDLMQRKAGFWIGGGIHTGLVCFCAHTACFCDQWDNQIASLRAKADEYQRPGRCAACSW